MKMTSPGMLLSIKLNLIVLLLLNIYIEKISFVKLKEVTNSALDYASTAVNISLGLIGIMALWLGVMKVAEEAGLISNNSKLAEADYNKTFPRCSC